MKCACCFEVIDWAVKSKERSRRIAACKCGRLGAALSEAKEMPKGKLLPTTIVHKALKFWITRVICGVLGPGNVRAAALSEAKEIVKWRGIDRGFLSVEWGHGWSVPPGTHSTGPAICMIKVVILARQARSCFSLLTRSALFQFAR
jgi:hypothetical protein